MIFLLCRANSPLLNFVVALSLCTVFGCSKRNPQNVIPGQFPQRGNSPGQTNPPTQGERQRPLGQTPQNQITELEGFWFLDCLVFPEAGLSVHAESFFEGNLYRYFIFFYTDSHCEEFYDYYEYNGTFRIGNTTTGGKEIDYFLDDGTTIYSIYSLSGNQLRFGVDATTPANRPTSVSNDVFIRIQN